MRHQSQFLHSCSLGHHIGELLGVDVERFVVGLILGKARQLLREHLVEEQGGGRALVL